jgi:hypothetical protein
MVWSWSSKKSSTMCRKTRLLCKYSITVGISHSEFEYNTIHNSLIIDYEQDIPGHRLWALRLMKSRTDQNFYRDLARDIALHNILLLFLESRYRLIREI